jgi:hypothetical protein
MKNRILIVISLLAIALGSQTALVANDQVQALVIKNGSATAAQIAICHKGRTITVNEMAWPAHLAHGDTKGPC